MTIDYTIAALLLASWLLFVAGRASIRRAKRRKWLYGERARIVGYDDKGPIVEFRKFHWWNKPKRYDHSSQAGGINKRKFFGG